MNDAQKLVADFLARWEDGVDATIGAMRDFMAADSIWKNSGFPDAVGLDASVALMQGFCQSLGLGRIGLDVSRYVTEGGDVVTERRDDLIDRAGKLILSMDVLGIFKVENGKIVSWHDYADPRDALEIAARAKAGSAS